MRAGVERHRQLQDVLEIARQYGLALAVREAVRMQRDDRADADGEQAEGGPGREQRPRRAAVLAREHVDDAAEQHGLGELRRRQQEIGDGEDPAEPRFLAEQFEDAGIEAEQGHCDELEPTAGWVTETY